MARKIATGGGGDEASQIRDKILAGAEDVFARFGLRGATTALIAERAGVSKPHIYYYFPSKEALYVAVLERTLKLWHEAIPHAAPGASPQDFLRQYIHAKLEFSRLQPRLSRIFANEALNGAPIIRTHIKTEMSAALETLVDLIKSWRAARKIEAIDATHLVFMIWAMTQHYADGAAQLEILLGKRQLGDADFRAAERTITRLVFGALGLDEDEKKP